MKPVKPVTWALLGIFSAYLAVVAASAYKEGSNIFVWMGHFSEVLKRPSLLRWTPYTVKCIVIVLLLCAFAVLLYRSDREKRRPGGEYGTAKWGAAETMNQKYADKDGPNVILTQHVSIGMDGYKHQRNLNVLVVGGSGSGKTRFFCKPNIMQANGSFLVTDPKGEMLRALAPLLLEEGYVLRVFDLIDPQHSDAFNPFSYIRDAKDVMKLVNNLIQNTTPKNAQQSDPFWERSEVALDTALMLYLLYEAPPEEQNFETVLYMLENGGASEEDESYRSPLDLLFEALEEEEPDHIAVREYHIFQQAAGKTARSILITAAVRLSAFIIPQIRDITSHDEMELSLMGERKQAVFAVIPDSDSTFNYLVGMLYTCAFQSLYYQADKVHQGPLPVPVRLMMDEFCNVALPSDFVKIQSTMRSRNIMSTIVLQNISGPKALFKDDWEGLLGNADTLLYLGGNEQSTHKYISELLGKETLDVRHTSTTKGRNGSTSVSRQQLARDLMTPDEVRAMDNRYALLFIRGEKPVRDKKYDIKKHPNYRYTQDGGAKPYIHNPPPAPDYALTDLPYVFRTLDDFRFLEDEYEQEKQEKKENRRQYLRERGAVLMRCYHRLRNRR